MVEPMPTKSKAFGRALKKIRLKKKLTQESLSLEAQLARVYISELEYGKKTPSIETVFKISKALNIKCSKLMDLTEEEFIR
jgi:transcriptional regulator with XRE-family HTH domain